MHVIFKYPILPGQFTLDLPDDFEVIHVGEQNNEPMVWISLNTMAKTNTQLFVAVATGEQYVKNDVIHVGTFILNGGALVFHLLRQKREGD